jgi:molecular chaperone GrpE
MTDGALPEKEKRERGAGGRNGGARPPAPEGSASDAVDLHEVVEERAQENPTEGVDVDLSEVVEEEPAPREAEGSDLPVDLDEVIRQKDSALAEMQDKYLRLAADFDNFKKRIQKEKAEFLKYANEHLGRQLLDAIDNLERAVAHSESSDKQALIDGIQLVDNIFLQTLERFGIKRFSALGQPFDPAFHEAVQEVHSADVVAGAVAFEVHKGYTYHDRLLRPARVVLSKGPPPKLEEPAEAGPSGGPSDSEEGGPQE